MFDLLTNFYNGLPELIKIPVWFAFNIILIRGILANEIMLEIRQRGWFKGGILHRTVKRIDKWYLLARKSAIFQHYRLQAQGNGHESNSVLDCSSGRCAII